MTWHDPPRRAHGVRSVPMDDDVVVFRVDTAAAVNLEGTGSLIWQLIDGRATCDAIVEELAAEFDAAPEHIASDVRTLLDRLLDLGLIVGDPTVAGDGADAPTPQPSVLPDPPSP